MLTANPLDSQVMGAQIGTGDGVTTRFQLLHPYGEFKDEVQAPRGTVHVYEDGIPTTAFTVDATGGVVFTIAPVAGCANLCRLRLVLPGAVLRRYGGMGKFLLSVL